MILENGVLIQAVLSILLRRGVISEDEVDRELETLNRELGDDGDESGKE